MQTRFNLPPSVWKKIDRQVLRNIPGAKMTNISSRMSYTEDQMMAAVLWKLWSGDSWAEVGRYGKIPVQAARNQYTRWFELGVFEKIGELGFKNQVIGGVNWEWLNNIKLMMQGQEPVKYRPKPLNFSRLEGGRVHW